MFKKKEKTVSMDVVEDALANERGRRVLQGRTRYLVVWVTIAWSVFQLYYASPLPYILQGFLHQLNLNWLNVVVDDTRARSIHLAFALFLAFILYPPLKKSSSNQIAWFDWLFAISGAFLAAYYLFFYNGIIDRVGAPNLQDKIAGTVGILLLLEAARRSVGTPLVIISSIFLIYNFLGQFFPTQWIVSHRSGTISHIINQQWITTEGVFGIPLGVSAKFVFLFVLFGALLEKAGAGNYFIKTAFAFLGHFRGGPAKASVVASGLTGLTSGSSMANVITTGTFTIPLMKKVGFDNEKAGAIEVSCSVDGQIMPPVMGAAAFIMVEYVGMPYNQLITHAFLPAIISYFALFYVVHLEALKNNFRGLERIDPPSSFFINILRALGTFISIFLLYTVVKYGLGWIQTLMPQFSMVIIFVLILLTYFGLIYRVSLFPDLEVEDPNAPIEKLPSVKPTLNSGLHFILPVIILIWSLMIERLSPALSAFWGIMALAFVLVTQNPLLAFFRKQELTIEKLKFFFKKGLQDLSEGLQTGARNMVSIGIATATAGIIVGVVALTGFGVQLSNIIEIISMGNLVFMLVLVAIFSLILGMGLPTTANYIVVSSLMASVIVEVGGQNGLIVPFIAVHLFVFYFGIMADVTPPVGLAAFAAAAVSGGDPIKTGVRAFFYSLRTAILPFLFIFNTDLLLIDVTLLQGFLVFIIATIGILSFTSATMNFFFRKNKWYESILLFVIAFALFRPGFFMEYISASHKQVAPISLAQEISSLPDGEKITLKVAGMDEFGSYKKFYTQLEIPSSTEIETGIEKNKGSAILNQWGIRLVKNDKNIEQELNEPVLIDYVKLGSAADKAGLDWDQNILEVSIPLHDALPKELIFIPALLLLGLLGWHQRRTTTT